MKKLKQLVIDLKGQQITSSPEHLEMLWQLICYPPKVPLRLHQEQLMNEARRFELPVIDEYFTGNELAFNVFVWGNGKHKILITHGWGSKAADFNDMINALRQLDDVQIISFDAPGNGSSESTLSNLILFIEAVKSVILHFGVPDVLVGHSLGVMANIIALNQLKLKPSLLVSIAPLVRLKENFEESMEGVGTPKPVQEIFMQQFEYKFRMTAASFNLNDLYQTTHGVNHWLAFDTDDQVSHYNYLHSFLTENTAINSHAYRGAGHDKIIRLPALLSDLISQIKLYL
jgi:pimeloyl-ACP methyl ester carboxylesterase